MPTTSLESLTAAQLAAVRHQDGPCLVIAGAGTGKTLVITQRIAHLIQERAVDPELIVALTFTDKSAKEMEMRVDELLPYGLSRAHIATFHSYCADLLTRHAFLIGIDPASHLMTEADEIGFLRQHLEELPTNLYKPARNPVEFLSALIQYLSKLKDEDISPEKLLEYATNKKQTATTEGDSEEAQKSIELAGVYAEANKLYRENSLLSYGDLIYYTLQLLRQFPSVLQEEQRRISYLLIDEFQDTNFVQNEVARLLAGEQANIMAVGDDDQAIYRFRGATLANIMGFTHSFPTTQIITLTDNYRSTQPILDAAYRLIQHNNPGRLEVQEKLNKRLLSHRPEKTLPEHLHFAQSYQEYQSIISHIQTLLAEGYAPSDIALLIRSRNQASSIESALKAANIPYQINGTTKFYNLPIVETAVAYLRFLSDPHNDLNLFFLLSDSPFSFDSEELKKQLKEARYTNVSLWDLLKGSEQARYLKERLDKHTLKPSVAFLEFIHSSGWYQRLAKADTPEAVELLATLYQEILAYEQTHSEAKVMHYISQIDYLIATNEQITFRQESEVTSDGVQIMTIHKSKGLEFRAVFVINMVEGRFPSRNYSDSLPLPYELMKGSSSSSEEHLQEERRLAYVAMTRAKERLFLTSSEQYDERKTKAKISTFVLESLGTTTGPELATISSQDSLTFNESIPSQKKLVARLPTSLSPSALETFETCPLRYQYQYIWNIRVPSSHFANFGTSVHETLRAWFTLTLAGEKPNLEELYHKHWINGGYETKSYEQERYQEGLSRLKTYVAECENCNPVALETTVRAILPDGQVLHGKIDRIDQTKTGTLQIIDYKTKEKPAKLRELVDNIPLVSYVLALEQQGKIVSEVELHYVMAGERVILPVSELKKEETVIRAEALVEQIKESLATNSFKAKPSKIICDYCDYRDICPFRYGKL